MGFWGLGQVFIMTPGVKACSCIWSSAEGLSSANTEASPTQLQEVLKFVAFNSKSAFV